MTFEIWLAFVAASIAILLVPGPTILLVLSYALSQGKKVAMATAAGVALGDLIAMTISLAGFGALVYASATLFLILKWIGALYLIYLGIKLFKSAKEITPIDFETHAKVSAKSVFLNSAAVTALNPKSILFFVALVPQFITSGSSLVPQFVILITTFVTLAAINAFAYAILADKLRTKISKPSRLQWMTRFGGGALIAMGIAALSVKRGVSV